MFTFTPKTWIYIMTVCFILNLAVIFSGTASMFTWAAIVLCPISLVLNIFEYNQEQKDK